MVVGYPRPEAPPTMKRAKVLLIFVFALLAALTPFVGPPVWRLVVFKKIPFPDPRFASPTRFWDDSWRIRGWYQVKRWGNPYQHWREVWIYTENGLVHSVRDTIDRETRKTVWSPDGTIVKQLHDTVSKRAWRLSPPWWFGVTDQVPPEGKADGR